MKKKIAFAIFLILFLNIFLIQQALAQEQKTLGYIVELQQEPLIKQYTAQKQLQQQVQPKIAMAGSLAQYKYKYELASTLDPAITQSMSSFKQLMQTEHNVFKNKAKQTLNPSTNTITANAVAEQDNGLIVLGETFNVINSIGLLITEQQAQALEQLPNVKRVYPNKLNELITTDTTSLIKADQVHLLDEDGNNCADTDKQCLTGKGIDIGIFDTGIDYTHPDFGSCTTEQFLAQEYCDKGGSTVRGFDFSGDVFIDYTDYYDEDGNFKEDEFYSKIVTDFDPMDYDGHGTHVASIAAGNGELMKGIAPDANIAMFKVRPNSYDLVLLTALDYALDPDQDEDFSDHIDIISMSLSDYCKKYYLEGKTKSIYNEICGPDDIKSRAINMVVDAGIIAIIGAGNFGPTEQTIGSPATAQKAISVGAGFKKTYPVDPWIPGSVFSTRTTCLDHYPTENDIACFSSRGPIIEKDENDNEQTLTKPDIIAPGVEICAAKWKGSSSPETQDYHSCLDTGKHLTKSGTSMSTPVVAGAVALLKQAHPDLTPEQIKQRLMDTAITLDSYDINTQGAGLLDIKAAIGLECRNGYQRDCYTDPENTIKGTQTCTDDLWGDCLPDEDIDQQSCTETWTTVTCEQEIENCDTYNQNKDDGYCCGDDNEFYKTRLINNDVQYNVAWGNDPSDAACCDNINNCVSNGVCYHGIADISGVDNDKKVICANGKWIDVDSTTTICETAGLKLVKSGEPGVGEYDSKEDGGPETEFECCGDDANEYLITNNCDDSLSLEVCCDNPDDKVNKDGKCVEQCCECNIEQKDECHATELSKKCDGCNYIDATDVEVCDDKDHDCDTHKHLDDQDNPFTTTSGCVQEGACQGSIKTCTAEGAWSECSILLQPEQCDAIDHNCDGDKNKDDLGEVLTTTSNCDQDGSCAGSEKTCTAEGAWSTCSILPGDSEICGDNIDNNCDGNTDEDCVCTTDETKECGTDIGECEKGTQTCVKGQWDDCKDSIESTTETCDNKDNDCDGTIDNDVQKTTYYQDSDKDNYGNNAVSQQACTKPKDYVTDNTDCDDTDKKKNPGKTEVCDNKDNDCDGTIDNNVQKTTYYQDSDKDNYGNNAVSQQACTKPKDYVTDNTDCDDTNKKINPGEKEKCDNIDNNCNQQIDEGKTTIFYKDSDEDGFGNLSEPIQACSRPSGYVTDSTDCNDTVKKINPGETEVCDYMDNNCNQKTDEGVSITFYKDSDKDSFGDNSVQIKSCTKPSTYVTTNTDCNDKDKKIKPGAKEICDKADNDCNSKVDDLLDCKIGFDIEDKKGLIKKDFIKELNKTKQFILRKNNITHIKINLTNYSNLDKIDFNKIKITKQNSSDKKGFVLLKGLSLTNMTKILYLDRVIKSSNAVCIKDQEVENITQVSAKCKGKNETLIKCPGKKLHYTCEKQDDKFVITGLKHSAAVEFVSASPTTTTIIRGGPAASSTAGRAVNRKCADKVDNDGDGLIDMKDPGCKSLNDDDETDVKVSTALKPSCFDKKKNQDETGIDCGGPCQACKKPEPKTPTPSPKKQIAKPIQPKTETQKSMSLMLIGALSFIFILPIFIYFIVKITKR